MCTPLAIASAGAMLGSTLLNMGQADAQAGARSDAVNAETQRQKKLRREAQSALANSEAKYQDVTENEDQTAQSLGDRLNANTRRAGPSANAMPQASDPTVVREVNAQQGKANQYSTQQGDALGRLRSFGDLLGTANRQLMGDRGWINTLGGFQRGSSAVLPLELEAANEAGSTMGLFADLLGGAGQLGMMGGLSGGGMPLGAPQTPGTVGNLGSLMNSPASSTPWTTKGSSFRLFG